MGVMGHHAQTFVFVHRSQFESKVLESWGKVSHQAFVQTPSIGKIVAFLIVDKNANKCWCVFEKKLRSSILDFPTAILRFHSTPKFILKTRLRPSSHNPRVVQELRLEVVFSIFWSGLKFEKFGANYDQNQRFKVISVNYTNNVRNGKW